MCVYEYIFGTIRVYILIVTIIYINTKILYGLYVTYMCVHIYVKESLSVWSKNFNNSFATIFFFIGDNNLLIHIINEKAFFIVEE